MTDKRPTLTLNHETKAANPAHIARPLNAKPMRSAPNHNKHAWADAALREALASAAGEPSPA